VDPDQRRQAFALLTLPSSSTHENVYGSKLKLLDQKRYVDQSRCLNRLSALHSSAPMRWRSVS